MKPFSENSSFITSLFKEIIMKRLSNFASALTISYVSITSTFAVFYSEIFVYDDPLNAKGLHLCLKGEGWEAHDVNVDDIPFHQQIYGNKNIMNKYADGQVRTNESVQKRILDSIHNRFGQGHPHGMATVFNNRKEPFMSVAGGFG